MSMISFYFCHKNCTNFFLDFSHYFIIDSTSSWELTLNFFLIFCLLSFVPEILPKTLSWHSAQTRYLVDNWCERKNISVLSQSLFFSLWFKYEKCIYNKVLYKYMEILFMMVSNLLHVLKLLSYQQMETLADIKQNINSSVPSLWTIQVQFQL